MVDISKDLRNTLLNFLRGPKLNAQEATFVLGPFFERFLKKAGPVELGKKTSKLILNEILPTE